MKPRCVVITIEAESNAPLKVLHDKTAYNDLCDGRFFYEFKVQQVSANVIKRPAKESHNG